MTTVTTTWRTATSRAPRAAAVAFALVFFLAFAYAPLLRAGLLARDCELLALGARSVASFEASELRPLEAFSLNLSRRLFGAVEPGLGWSAAAFFLRLENLVLLLGAALALGLLTWRLLLPWCGSEQATAAARAAAAILALHPLATSAVASLEARGELLGLFFALTSAALFLVGRQDRRFGLTATSFVLCAVGGFASSLVLVLPLFFAGFEFVSSHRYRPLLRRLRTSLTTLLFFGLAAGLESLFQRVHASGAPPASVFTSLANVDGLELARSSAEKLGLLVLPANPGVLGIGGAIVAGAIFLVAMQPALVAARSAPRLWGWMLAFWFLALFATELVHASVPVQAQNLELAHVLLPSAAVMAVGLGIGSTALSGPRHPYVAWAVVLVYSALSFANAYPWTRAAGEVAGLRASLLEARERFGEEARFLVLDPPAATHGIDPVGTSLSYLLEPTGAGLTDDEPLAAGIGREGFLLLLRQPELETLRQKELVLVLPEELVVFGDDAERVSLVLPPPRSSSGPRSWRGLRSPPLDLEPQQELALRAKGGEPGALGPVWWSTHGTQRVHPEIAPVWLRGSDGLVAHYDLGGSFDWVLGGRARLLWFEEGVLTTDNEVLSELPGFAEAVQWRATGRDWSFVRPDTGGLEPVDGTGRFQLVLLDLAWLESETVSLERRDDELLAVGAEAFVEQTLAAGRGPVVWALEWCVQDAVILRAEGRVP